MQLHLPRTLLVGLHWQLTQGARACWIAQSVATLVLGASLGPMAHYVLRFLFIDLSHCVVRSSMSMQQFVHLRLQCLRVTVLRALN